MTQPQTSSSPGGKSVHPLARLFLALYSVIFLAALIAFCFQSVEVGPRLVSVSAVAKEQPREALAYLDSIDPSTLSSLDRHLYDFLLVKAYDKAHITHTSDSLILSVIDYSASHPTDPIHRAEVLYYGGRVYSDLGDYPTALSYFQQALDALPKTPETTQLRSTILNQTALLFTRMGLNSEAIGRLVEVIDIGTSVGIPQEEKESMMTIISILTVAEIITVVGAGAILLFYFIRNRQRLDKVDTNILKVAANLRMISDNVENLSREQARSKQADDPAPENQIHNCLDIDSEVRLRANVEERRLTLQKRLLDAAALNSDIPYRPEFSDTEIQRTLKSIAAEGKHLSNGNLLWNDLEQTISKVAPDALPTLRLLTRGDHTVSEWKAALLTIVGLSTSEMMVLLARTRGAVDSRRGSLGQKMFDSKVNIPVVVNALHLL